LVMKALYTGCAGCASGLMVLMQSSDVPRHCQ
jgi:hypothetical protein